jgi:hypothetical protein
MEIYNTNNSFNFENLLLNKPTSIPGGNYFIRFFINNGPLYIQPPKCKTRQGVVKAGKRHYCDLMFTNENEKFIQWMENLENYCQQYIFKNRDKWFDGDMELHDIENYFTSPLKIYKSGKYYVSRTNITNVLGKMNLKIYDENENEINYENINDNTNIITILEVQGIKCSSKSFQIEIELKQMMVLQDTDIFEKCIITSLSNKNKNSSIENNTNNSTTINSLKEKHNNDNNNGDNENNHGDNENNHGDNENNNGDNENNNGDNENNNGDNENNNGDNENNNGDNENNNNNINLKINDNDELIEEIEINLEELKDIKPIIIKERNNVYYEMYKEAKNKAKIARDLALTAYLEAKRIKNTYMLKDIDEDEDDEDNEYDEEYQDDDEKNE